MTTENAIKKIEYGLEMETSEHTPFGQLTVVSTEALKKALSALRTQQGTEKNEPLTLDELREMDGEPVWWWNNSAKPVCTICVRDRFMNEPMFANYDWQSEDTLKLTKYKWLKKCGYKPYRRKPEEGTT